MSNNVKLVDTQLSRICRALNVQGIKYHNRADKAQQASNFQLRITCREEGDRCWALARYLREQKECN